MPIRPCHVLKHLAKHVIWHDKLFSKMYIFCLPLHRKVSGSWISVYTHQPLLESVWKKSWSGLSILTTARSTRDRLGEVETGEKDLANRWVQSRWRKVMDNDSAEVTSSGRSFHVRGPTTGKARLVGDGCQLNRRHCQTVVTELNWTEKCHFSSLPFSSLLSQNVSRLNGASFRLSSRGVLRRGRR